MDIRNRRYLTYFVMLEVTDYGLAPITGLVVEVVVGVIVGSSWRLYVGLGSKSITGGSTRISW